MNDVPIDKAAAVAISGRLQDIAKLIDIDLEQIAGKRVSFSLFVWSDGYANFVSSAERHDIIPVLLKMIARWIESGGDDGPAHEALK